MKHQAHHHHRPPTAIVTTIRGWRFNVRTTEHLSMEGRCPAPAYQFKVERVGKTGKANRIIRTDRSVNGRAGDCASAAERLMTQAWKARMTERSENRKAARMAARVTKRSR